MGALHSLHLNEAATVSLDIGSHPLIQVDYRFGRRANVSRIAWDSLAFWRFLSALAPVDKSPSPLLRRSGFRQSADR